MALDLESPLAMASFLANTANGQKLFIPASTNMTSILKSIERQKSEILICD